MRPAFDSPGQAAAFALLLLLLLTAPWLAGKTLLPPRQQAYAAPGWTWGPYPWIERQIFNETNAIDIAFIGSSHLMWGIDTPYVQRQLDERLGHPSVVRSICWGGAGFDALYFITRDLLAHRHVKTLVFYDESSSVYINPKAPNWFRFGDDAWALAGLPAWYKSIYYFGATLEMPRNILELMIPNLPEDTNARIPGYFETHYHAENPEHRLGSASGRTGFDLMLGVKNPFVPFAPKTAVTPADLCRYTPASGSNFTFAGLTMPPSQVYFARQFGLLTKQHGCQLVLLHLPVRAEKYPRVIAETTYWPALLQTDVAMMGIPWERLFQDLSPQQVDELFGDPGHLNQNGQEYFTPLITPELLQIYESRTTH